MVEIVVVELPHAKHGGGRPAILCPGCGRRCWQLHPSPSARVPPLQPPPVPLRPVRGHGRGFFSAPDLDLRPVGTAEQRSLSWLCTTCCGGIRRGGRRQRMRRTISALYNDERRGLRRTGESWKEENCRERRLQEALEEVQAVEAREVGVMAKRFGLQASVSIRAPGSLIRGPLVPIKAASTSG